MPSCQTPFLINVQGKTIYPLHGLELLIWGLLRQLGASVFIVEQLKDKNNQELHDVAGRRVLVTDLCVLTPGALALRESCIRTLMVSRSTRQSAHPSHNPSIETGNPYLKDGRQELPSYRHHHQLFFFDTSG